MARSPLLIDRILGQMESNDPNTRGIAFEKARSMLAEDKVTFRDLFAAHLAVESQKAAEKEKASVAAKAAASAAAAAAAAKTEADERTAQMARATANARAAASAPPPHKQPQRTGWGDPDLNYDRKKHTKRNGTAKRTHKRRSWFFTRRIGDKMVVRNMPPPKGSLGVLRILSDRIVEGGHPSFPRHRFVASFETDTIIYEPFVEEGDSPGWIQQKHRLSATQAKIIW